MANIKTFDLNLLKVLDALLQERTTVKAGEALGLSQPAVSAALARLRAAFGDELFFRKGQGMEPTKLALSLERPVRDILATVENILTSTPEFDPAKSTDRFKLSASDFFAELLMPPLAERLQIKAPGMRLHLVDLVADSYIQTLERHEVDIALVPKIDLPGWAEGEYIFRSGFVVIARKGNPRLQRHNVEPGQVVPLDLYCDMGHVLFSPEGNEEGLGDAALKEVGRKRHVVMTMPVFSGVYRAVAGSDLIALLPVQLARKVAPIVGLELYLPPMHISDVPLMMIWHKRNSANTAHIWLRNQIADLVRDMDAPLHSRRISCSADEIGKPP